MPDVLIHESQVQGRNIYLWLGILLPLLCISMKYLRIWKVSNNNTVVWTGLRPGKRFSKFVDCCAWFDWPLLDENCLKLGDNPSIWINCYPFWPKVHLKNVEHQVYKFLLSKSLSFYSPNHHTFLKQITINTLS